MSLLDIQNLVTSFKTSRGWVNAVDGVSFSIEDGEAVGLVGESGCGKSVTALSIMRLIATPPGRISQGHIKFGDVDILSLSEREMRKVRGAKISMVFQEPMTSLNPVFTVGSQITEAIRLHQDASKSKAREKAIAILDRVGIPQANSRIDNYPHEMSGGMRQRVMIAMALSCNPQLLIADEPTTALDVTIQAQILALLKELQREFKMSILLISHDLGVVAELVKKVIVMYAGKVVEIASVIDLFNNPLHPYTQGLYGSLPGVARQRNENRLHAIPGVVPELGKLPVGCRFRDRCPKATPECGQQEPELVELKPNHFVRCIHADAG